MSNKESNTANDQLAIPALSAPDFFITTSQEMDALERAAADGVHGRHYTNLPMEPARVHKVPGSTYYVRLELTREEQMAGAQHQLLETMTEAQDADSALAFLYISRLLAPPSPLEPNTTATAKVEFDDVIKKIGWDPRSSEERRELHKRLFDFVRFGERAQVNGARRGIYKDKHTGEAINTEVRSALWRIMDAEQPAEDSHYTDKNTPVSVTLAIHPRWAELLTGAQTAQYLPMGEILGAIPGSRTKGAWARVIGLALASVWRRNPRKCMDGSIRPTRKELVERYPPKTGPVDLILKSTEPKVAIDYWCGALKILLEMGFIEATGDALLTPDEMRKKYPRKGWADLWFNEKVDIAPGALMRSVLTDRAKALPTKPIPSKKRGRPKKIQA